MTNEQIISDMADFIISENLQEKFIQFVAKADKEDYQEILNNNF